MKHRIPLITDKNTDTISPDYLTLTSVGNHRLPLTKVLEGTYGFRCLPVQRLFFLPHHKRVLEHIRFSNGLMNFMDHVTFAIHLTTI